MLPKPTYVVLDAVSVVYLYMLIQNQSKSFTWYGTRESVLDSHFLISSALQAMTASFHIVSTSRSINIVPSDAMLSELLTALLNKTGRQRVLV